MSQKRTPLFDTTEDQTLRIQKELAVKIGFNEAVILMQLEYLISISDKQIEGNLWTYQTLEELRENSFPWWSISTISRALTSLEDQGLIFIGNFNKHKRDRTQWFSLNFSKIKEIGIRLNDKNPILQNEKWEQADIIMKSEAAPEEEIEPEKEAEAAAESPPILQFEKSILQNEMTLPKTPSEILSPIGDSGKPPEDSQKWNKANKTIVGNKFLELTRITPPSPGSKAAGAWWGWLFEIFEMCGRDSTETCRVMGIVVSHMRHKRTDILTPKSLINYSRVVASGQELNGTDNYGQAAPRASPQATALDLEQQEKYHKIRESERQ